MTLLQFILLLLTIFFVGLTIVHRTHKRERLVNKVANDFPKSMFKDILLGFENSSAVLVSKLNGAVFSIRYKISNIEVCYKKQLYKIYDCETALFNVWCVNIPITDISIKFDTGEEIISRFIDQSKFGNSFHFVRGLNFINFVQGNTETTFHYNGKSAREIKVEKGKEIVSSMSLGKLIWHNKLNIDEEFYKDLFISLKTMIERSL